MKKVKNKLLTWTQQHQSCPFRKYIGLYIENLEAI